MESEVGSVEGLSDTGWDVSSFLGASPRAFLWILRYIKLEIF